MGPQKSKNKTVSYFFIIIVSRRVLRRMIKMLTQNTLNEGIYKISRMQ